MRASGRRDLLTLGGPDDDAVLAVLIGVAALYSFPLLVGEEYLANHQQQNIQAASNPFGARPAQQPIQAAGNPFGARPKQAPIQAARLSNQFN